MDLLLYATDRLSYRSVVPRFCCASAPCRESQFYQIPSPGPHAAGGTMPGRAGRWCPASVPRPYILMRFANLITYEWRRCSMTDLLGPGEYADILRVLGRLLDAQDARLSEIFVHD